MTDNAEEINKIWTDSDVKWGVASLIGLGISSLMLLVSLGGYYFDLLSGIMAVVIGFASMIIGSFACSGIDYVAESVKRNKEQNIPKEDANIDDGIRYLYEKTIEDYIEKPLNIYQIEQFKKIESLRAPGIRKAHKIGLAVMLLTILAYAGFYIFISELMETAGNEEPFMALVRALSSPFILIVMGAITTVMAYVSTRSYFSNRAFEKNETTIRLLEWTTLHHSGRLLEESFDEDKVQGSEEAKTLMKNIKAIGRKPLRFEVDLFRKLCEF